MSALKAALDAYPLALPICVATAVRLFAAITGCGWFASDDYKFVIEQSGVWHQNAFAPFPSEIRSPLLPRIFWLATELGVKMGATDQASRLHVAYVSLGLWSVLTIPGAYFAALYRCGRSVAQIAAWLTAAYAIMPYISTRGLVEVVAMVPITWSLVALELGRAGSWRAATACGLLLGTASLFRFQVGLLYPVAVTYLVWPLPLQSANSGQRRWKLLLAALSGGALAAVCQGLIDIALDRRFFSTPIQYLIFNTENLSLFGTSPWYTYLLHLCMYAVPPAFILMAPHWLQAIRRNWAATAMLGVFVVVHSAVPHKEDRFLFPILPLFFILAAGAIVSAWRGTRWARTGVYLFGGINLVALCLVTFSDGYRGLTQPLLEIARSGRSASVASVGLKLSPSYYLGDKSTLKTFKDPPRLIAAVSNKTLIPDYVLFQPAPTPETLAQLSAAGLDCVKPRVYKGNLIDEALVMLNRHNRKRRQTTLYECIQRL